jgi:hypothetical protein
MFKARFWLIAQRHVTGGGGSVICGISREEMMRADRIAARTLQ